MNQIAFGDPYVGYIVLDGQSVAVPCFKATCYFTFSNELFVKEHIDIQLKGTPTQIASLIQKLDLQAQRAVLHDRAAYRFPQYLRFQLVAGGGYYYAILSNIYFEANPAGYLTAAAGSKLVRMHYTRPNYFDGDQVELPVTGRAGADIMGGYPLLNHTDGGAGHGSTVMIKKDNITATHLPAPIRFKYLLSSGAGVMAKDMFVGVYPHPAYDGDLAFFYYYNTLTGGSSFGPVGCIQDYYRQVTVTSSTFVQLTSQAISSANAAYMEGFTFRPILHLYLTHAYTDCYMKIQVQRGSEVLYVSEPVYSAPGYGYVILPPIEIPPNFLLREVAPAALDLVIYALRESGAAATISFDCLTLFPLVYAATFYGFTNIQQSESLIDDSHRERFNLLTGAGTGETVAHSRVGGPLLLFPTAYSRLFFYVTDNNNLMPINHTGSLYVYYRPRYRLL
jgi:hypothetical protein